MAAGRQLRLVTDTPPAHGTTEDPARVVFEHWVFMFGKHPGRTKLDAERRQAIQWALAQWALDDVLLAVEGMAAAPLGDKPESMRDAMREISWFLASAKRAERCMEYGDQLRQVAAHRPPAAPEAPAAAADPEAARAHRERLRQLAAQYRGSHG